MKAGVSVEVPLVLSGVDEMPVLLANHFLLQEYEGEFILTVGQLVPPPLLGTEAERREQAKQLTFVNVRVVARLGFTRKRLAEIVALLQDSLEQHRA